MWKARSRFFSTGFNPKPPNRFPGPKYLVLGLPFLLYGAYKSDEVKKFYNEKFLGEESNKLDKINDSKDFEKKYFVNLKREQDKDQIQRKFGTKHLGMNDMEKIMNERKQAENNSEVPVKVVDESVKVVETPVKVVEEPVKVVEEPVKVVEEPVKVVEEPVKVVEEPVKVIDEPVKVVEEPVKVVDEPVKLVDEPVKHPEEPVKVDEEPVKAIPIGDNSENVSIKIENLVEIVKKLKEEEKNQQSDNQFKEGSSQPNPKLSSTDLENIIQQLRSELSQEQQRRENELYNGIEDLFKTLISEYIPKGDSQHSPARVISSHIDFTKLSSDQIQKKFEDLINAYQDRLETLGVRNYDSFIERLKMQKNKWRAKIQEVQLEYEKQIGEEIKARDEQWKKVLYEEAADSEKHYETQAKIDSDYVRQETELELNKKFKGELDELTQTLEKATNERMKQLDEIVLKIKEMEKIQAEHYEIIIKLTKVHKLHIAIENMQRALLADKGNLTEDLNTIIAESKSSSQIKKSLETLEPVYSKLISEGIPKQKQLQEKFEKSSQNARRSAIIHSGSFFNILLSQIAIYFIPSNIRTVDDSNTFSHLKDAEDALARGDLKKASTSLKQLKGLPAEEMKEISEDIELRLAFTELVELLSATSISTVQQMINAKVLI